MAHAHMASMSMLTVSSSEAEANAHFASMSILSVHSSAAEASAYFGVGVGQCCNNLYLIYVCR
jgi:hypothetical protein